MSHGNIIFITHQLGTQGSYLNHLDLQQYLKDQESYRVKFYCQNVKKLFEVIKNTRRPYTFKPGEVKLLRKNLRLTGTDIVITDFKTLIYISKFKLKILCKKLLIMDSIELTYYLKEIKNARFFYDFDIYESLESFYSPEKIFLMPLNNYKIFKNKYPDLKAKVFYKNININMLKEIKCENINGYFFRWDVLRGYENLVKKQFGDNVKNFPPTWKIKKGKKIPLKYNEADHIFDYQALIYRRRKYLEYQEQFGRLIFEYILLGKDVYFMDEIYTDDGLTDYLNHYNIRFNGNKIATTKEELEQRMLDYNDKPWE